MRFPDSWVLDSALALESKCHARDRKFAGRKGESGRGGVLVVQKINERSRSSCAASLVQNPCSVHGFLVPWHTSMAECS